jgi:hypothetical protein
MGNDVPEGAAIHERHVARHDFVGSPIGVILSEARDDQRARDDLS